MMQFFRRGGRAGEKHQPERTRHSRGWAEVLKYMREDPSRSLRVLDFGVTSPTNINLLTSMGHSVYMAHVVTEAGKPEWLRAPEAGANAKAAPDFDAERFALSNLDFSGRDFDIILLWDTADYLPKALLATLFSRLSEVTRPQGRLLGFFHGKSEGPNTGYSRYQLTETDELRVTGNEALPIRQVLQNRQIEQYLSAFRGVRFFQGADNVREVIATR